VIFDCACSYLLADLQIWLSKNPHAQNQAYNVNNGDVFRFEQVSLAATSAPLPSTS
jgi:hypothetical protein